MDGAIIGLAYLANPVLGLPTALAIAAHEIPQEIGDFTILLDSGWKKITGLPQRMCKKRSLVKVISFFRSDRSRDRHTMQKK